MRSSVHPCGLVLAVATAALAAACAAGGEPSSPRVTGGPETAPAEDLGGGDVRTHELLAIDKVDGSRWMLTSANSCALRAGPAESTDAYGQADLTLDPDHPLEPAATEIHLLVTERACNSGEDAEGRVVLAELTESDDSVDLVIGVVPREGGHNCPSNPPTPFVVELDAPLGDRVVRDAAVVPPRELEPAQ